MKKPALAAAALLSLAALLTAVPPAARAAPGDTCYETATVNIDCSDKKAQPAKKAPAARPAKIAKTAPAAKAPILADRIRDAQERVKSALANHAAPGAEQEYKAAMADLHKVYGEAMAARPGDKTVASLVQGQEADFRSQGAQLEWSQARASDAPTPAEGKPAAAGPQDMMAAGALVYACDKEVAGNNVSCREISPGGTRCTAVILTDGAVAWRDSSETTCDDRDLQRRAAFLSADRELAEAVANREDFAMNHAETEAEIAKLTSPRCDLLVGSLVAAANKKDGKAAIEAYDALKAAGGCGALQYVEETGPAIDDSRFAERGARPMLQETAVACDRDQQSCAIMLEQLQEGTSGRAVAAMVDNAISVGLQLGGMMAQGLSLPQSPQIGGAAQRAAPARAAPQPRGEPVRAMSCIYSGCILDGTGRR